MNREGISLGRSLGISLGRSLYYDWSILRSSKLFSLGRSLGISLGRSLGRSLGIALNRSLGISLRGNSLRGNSLYSLGGNILLCHCRKSFFLSCLYSIYRV